MKRNFSIDTTYLINKYIKSKPYDIWEKIGEKMNWFNRYNELEKVKNQLRKTFLEVKKKHPDMFKDLDIDEE